MMEATIAGCAGTMIASFAMMVYGIVTLKKHQNEKLAIGMLVTGFLANVAVAGFAAWEAGAHQTTIDGLNAEAKQLNQQIKAQGEKLKQLDEFAKAKDVLTAGGKVGQYKSDGLAITYSGVRDKESEALMLPLLAIAQFLKSVSFEDTNIAVPELEKLAELAELAALDIRGNTFGDFAFLGKFERLEELRLARTNLTDEQLAAAFAAGLDPESIVELDLSFLTDFDSLEVLKPCTSLTTLRVQESGLIFQFEDGSRRRRDEAAFAKKIAETLPKLKRLVLQNSAFIEEARKALPNTTIE